MVDADYYVVSPAKDTLQLSETLGGAAVTFTDYGSGQHEIAICDFCYDDFLYAADGFDVVVGGVGAAGAPKSKILLCR